MRLPAFPHGAEIGGRLRRPFAGEAFLDPERCARRGVPAFTESGRAHFSLPAPGIGVAAHEAAHVLQQNGATRDMGLGAEGHAAAIERTIVAGRDSAALIGKKGAAPGHGPHHYTVLPQNAPSAARWNARMDLRVSEDGRMAARDGGLGSHYFWAENSAITQSNITLLTQGSGIYLQRQSEAISGPAPDASGRKTLTRILPKNLENASSGETMTMPSDCGDAARTVMGAHKGQDFAKMTARYKTAMPSGGGAPVTQDRTTAAFNPEEMRDEVLENIFKGWVGGIDLAPYLNDMARRLGISKAKAARRLYESVGPDVRDFIDKRAGINKYAMPATGEGYTTVTGGANVGGTRSWNFHWGGVVMTSGDDRVTLENYAHWEPENSKWKFQMYGSASKPGQTFHEQHKATDLHGTVPVTLPVHKEN